MMLIPVRIAMLRIINRFCERTLPATILSSIGSGAASGAAHLARSRKRKSQILFLLPMLLRKDHGNRQKPPDWPDWPDWPLHLASTWTSHLTGRNRSPEAFPHAQIGLLMQRLCAPMPPKLPSCLSLVHDAQLPPTTPSTSYWIPVDSSGHLHPHG